VAYTGLGDRDRAFAWIDSAIAGRASTTIFLAVQPEFRVLHGDPRFARAVQRIGLATP
jgi:hypothetical protein